MPEQQSLVSGAKPTAAARSRPAHRSGGAHDPPCLNGSAEVAQIWCVGEGKICDMRENYRGYGENM